VRRELAVEPSDTIPYDLEEDGVCIRKASPLDVEWAKAVESTLTE